MGKKSSSASFFSSLGSNKKSKSSLRNNNNNNSTQMDRNSILKSTLIQLIIFIVPGALFGYIIALIGHFLRQRKYLSSYVSWIPEPNSFMVLPFALLFAFVCPLLYIFATRFEKTVTIKEKMNVNGYRGTKFVIIDNTSTSYNIENVVFLFDFDNLNDYIKIEPGKTYNITGYGVLKKSIYRISEVSYQ